MGWEPALADRTVSRGRNKGSLPPDKGHGDTAMSQAYPYVKSIAWLSPTAHIGDPTGELNISQ